MYGVLRTVIHRYTSGEWRMTHLYFAVAEVSPIHAFASLLDYSGSFCIVVLFSSDSIIKRGGPKYGV